MLPHTVTLTKKTGVNTKGQPTYSAPVTIRFVRYETAKKNALTALGDQRNDTGLLFYDERNSVPSGVVFTPGDKVSFGGASFVVRDVSFEYADLATKHHQEVALV